MRPADQLPTKDTCSICLHAEDRHHVTKAQSTTGCASTGCPCQRFVQVTTLKGDATPEVTA